MNTISNSNHQPSFKMAFVKPDQNVIEHFSKIIHNLPTQERKLFVNEVGKIVESAKDCPVQIGHRLHNGYKTYYKPVVCGSSISSPVKSQIEAYQIIYDMKEAVVRAKNEADARENVRILTNIFDVKA